jgi:hypothetical protein
VFHRSQSYGGAAICTSVTFEQMQSIPKFGTERSKASFPNKNTTGRGFLGKSGHNSLLTSIDLGKVLFDF